jgi:hypothetical protein
LDVAGLDGGAQDVLRLAFEDADQRPSVEELLQSQLFTAAAKRLPADRACTESSARANDQAKCTDAAAAADIACQEEDLALADQAKPRRKSAVCDLQFAIEESRFGLELER